MAFVSERPVLSPWVTRRQGKACPMSMPHGATGWVTRNGLTTLAIDATCRHPREAGY
jgi:hypothetical protein